MLSLRFRGAMANFAAVWTSGDRWENVARSRLYTVGTTVKNVTGLLSFGLGRKGAAKRSHTAVALNGNRNSMVEPAKRGAMIAFMVPWMW